MKTSCPSGARAGIVAAATRLLIAACALPLAFSVLPAGAQDAGAAPRRGEPITMNFANADIEAVARTMAVVTGRDVVVDPRVKGSINLATDRPIAPAAAFNQFAAALRLQGFAVVESDGLYKVVPEADAKLQSGSVSTSVGGNAGAGSNQIVTQVFRLNYESPNNLLPVLRPLIPPNNTINANPGNNSLVITDYADNMRRLARIVAALDVPNAADIEVIPLKHAIAADLVPLITRLIEGGVAAAPVQGSADASFRTTLQAEPRSNALILRAANPARAALVRTLVDKLDRAPVDTGNGAAGNIYVVYLKNADAVRLATTLRAAMAAGGSTAGAGAGGGAGQQPAVPGSLQAASQQLSTVSGGASSAATAPLSGTAPPSTGGQIQADPSTNSLIITAPEPQYRQLRAVIDRLDGRRAQVMVETLIVEVNARKAAEFGVQWQTALNGGGRNAAVLGNNSSLAGANIIDLALGLATRNPSIRPSSGFNFGIGHKSNGEYVLGFLARFLEGDGEGNVLSTPNLLTLDNEEAKIVIGQNVPFITGQYASTNGNSSTINPFTTVERKDVGLTLRVRPQINENGSLKLVIFQEVSNVDQATRADVNGPTTNKRSIESTVMVDDGSIVMLGGLLQDDYSGSTEKIPLAGDIPVLGNLFKSEVRNRNKTNLMVFIRPVVMRDGATTDAFAADRYDAIRSQQLALQPEPATMLRNVDAAPVLPALAPPPSEAERASRRIEGTRLVPPPLASPDVRIQRAAATQGPMRGVLPATADPLSRRELP